MNREIQPEYNTEAKAICACGNTFTTGSVKEELRVEVCSECHPFYTGAQRSAERGGRIERFQRKYGVKEEAKEEKEETEEK